ncbi:hypothetical protein HDV03_005512 [Kappamyces sp. JEL0829]|nr:hypothetical protein HDV03_005512 [Kappamyces sp. JEL0829]
MTESVWVAATLTPALSLLITIYSIGVGFEITVMMVAIGIRHILNKSFLRYGIICISAIMIGFVICMYYLLYVTTDCTPGRKAAYAFFYFGFLTYDYYQLKNVSRRTKPARLIRYGFYFLFLARIVSCIYNVVMVEGVVAYPLADGATTGPGPCKSQFSRVMIYQEHLVTTIFEIAVVIHVFRHAQNLVTKKASLMAIILNVFDFETQSFVFYMLTEVCYIIVYSIIPSALVSYLNTFYLQLPVLLFLVNACHFTIPKDVKAAKVGIKRMPIRSDVKSMIPHPGTNNTDAGPSSDMANTVRLYRK